MDLVPSPRRHFHRMEVTTHSWLWMGLYPCGAPQIATLHGQQNCQLIKGFICFDFHQTVLGWLFLLWMDRAGHGCWKTAPYRPRLLQYIQREGLEGSDILAARKDGHAQILAKQSSDGFHSKIARVYGCIWTVKSFNLMGVTHAVLSQMNSSYTHYGHPCFHCYPSSNTSAALFHL